MRIKITAIFLITLTILTACSESIPPNTVIEETRKTDVIYAGNNIYYELTAHQISPISESNSEHYKDLAIGDIVRVNAIIRSETINFGYAGGTTYITFEDISEIDIISDEYYQENDFGAIPIDKNKFPAEESAADGASVEMQLRYNAWKYLYDGEKGCYISVIASTLGREIYGRHGIEKNTVLENGIITGEYDRFVSIPYGGYECLLLVNDDVAVSDIEKGLASGDYSEFYFIAKVALRSLYFSGENIENLSVDYAYQGDGVFLTLSESKYNNLNLTEFTDCSDYQVGEVFRINADFISQALRHQGNFASERIIDKLHSIEKISPENIVSIEETSIVEFSPTTPFKDRKQYVYFVDITYAKTAYNTDTGKTLMMVSIPATRESVRHYKLFEDGEHVGDFNELQTFDDEKAKIRHVVFFNNRVGEPVFSLADLENRLNSGDLSDIYYIGYGYLDVLFPNR
ncbi:MAG: hypothetical protein FWG70_05315 [Oscillospiraceae bacterium]|nr:hypothetical protein [Oscillospiraceae bacterium]